MASTRTFALRVALLSTAAVDAPGSMRAYADTLLHCLGRYAPGIDAELVELEPLSARGRLGQRWQTLSQPWRARRLPQRPHLWHVLDGSRGNLSLHLSGAPVLVTVHDIIPWLQDRGRFPGQPRLGRPARSWWLANAKGYHAAAMLVCDSERSAIDAQQAFGIAPSTCRTVPLPLRPRMAEQAATHWAVRENGVVLHVGNNAFYKNRAGALRIFARMKAGIARELLMAGPEPGRALVELAASLGIAGRVRWVCNPDDAELAAVYRSASVLLFPSLYEGYGWPVLEAMAFGLPVVASNAGSLPELIGDPGEGIAPDDEAAFAVAAERIMSSPEVAEDRRKRGLQRAAEFSSARFGTDMASCYLQAVQSRSGARA